MTRTKRPGEREVVRAIELGVGIRSAQGECFTAQVEGRLAPTFLAGEGAWTHPHFFVWRKEGAFHYALAPIAPGTQPMKVSFVKW